MLFFFSSRRRHTRFDCDWSSDVCSSDLADEAGAAAAAHGGSAGPGPVRITLNINGQARTAEEIGRASCRERVEIWDAAGSLKRKEYRLCVEDSERQGVEF